MTILYVDDDPDDRQLFEEAVKSIDERIVCATAQDGLDALAYLSMNTLPDIIFLDINMPLMNGKTCLMEIRCNRDTADLPVIIFTTSNSIDERVECESLGATDFLLKPVSFHQWKDSISSLLYSTNMMSA